MAGFLNTIILLGAIQGFIICVLLWFNKRNQPSHRLLAVLILLMSLASINLYFLHTGWFESTATLRVIAAIVPLVIFMPAGPLIYFYIQSCFDPAFTITGKRALHFYPTILDIVPQLTAVVYLAGVSLNLFKPDNQSWTEFIDSYNVYADIPRWISLTGYLWLSNRYLTAHKTASRGGGNPLTWSVGWLQQFIYTFLAFQLLWLLYLVPYSIPRYTDSLLGWVDWYPIYLPITVMIYWMGIKGYLAAQVVHPGPEKKKKGIAANIPVDTVQQTVLLLTKAMQEDKLYLNPALNLDLLSQHTGLTPKMISAVLNQHLQKNFSEWMNDYRVAAFRRKIGQGGIRHLTISGIASECGFSSQATFQRIFKQSAGMTPSQYLKKHTETV